MNRPVQAELPLRRALFLGCRGRRILIAGYASKQVPSRKRVGGAEALWSDRLMFHYRAAVVSLLLLRPDRDARRED